MILLRFPRPDKSNYKVNKVIFGGRIVAIVISMNGKIFQAVKGGVKISGRDFVHRINNSNYQFTDIKSL